MLAAEHAQAAVAAAVEVDHLGHGRWLKAELREGVEEPLGQRGPAAAVSGGLGYEAVDLLEFRIEVDAQSAQACVIAQRVAGRQVGGASEAAPVYVHLIAALLDAHVAEDERYHARVEEQAFAPQRLEHRKRWREWGKLAPAFEQGHLVRAGELCRRRAPAGSCAYDQCCSHVLLLF